jgi:hypothetical protein
MWLPCAEQRMIFILAPESPFGIKCYFRLDVILKQTWSKIHKLRKQSQEFRFRDNFVFNRFVHMQLYCYV